MVDERENFLEQEEFHLINYVNVVLKRRWLIIAGVLLCVIFTGIYSKSLPHVFTASAKFLPSKNPEMTSRMGTLIGTRNKNLLFGCGGRVSLFESIFPSFHRKDRKEV